MPGNKTTGNVVSRTMIVYIILIISAMILMWLAAPWFSARMAVMLTGNSRVPEDESSISRYSPSLDDGGVVGDSFGSINALFSGLALAGVILALVLQRREVAYQLQEMRDAFDLHAARFEFEKNQAKKRVTLDLYNEFHSDLFPAREKAEELIEAMSDAERGSTAALKTHEDQVSVWRVLHFFQKWGVLKQEGQLDDNLAWELLGFYYEWWEKTYLRLLVEDPDFPPDWTYTFDTIWLVLGDGERPPQKYPHIHREKPESRQKMTTSDDG
jgi:hypothetical protein